MKKFQRFRIGAFALAFLAILVGVGVAAEQSVVMLNLTQPIEAKKSSTATAKFAELTQDAMKYGMADAYISGQVEYSMQPDKTIRSNIKWTAISIENAGKKVTEGLDQTLASAFRVPESSPRAEPGTKLKAVGDVDALAVSLGKLKAQLDAQGAPVQKETNTTKNQTQAVSPTVQAQDSNQDKYLADAGNPFNTVVEAGTQTSYVACDDYFVDIASMKAVKQYKPVYTKNGTQTGEGVCAPNYSEFLPIQSQDGTCTYRFDFGNNTAAKQQQLYYLNGSTEVPVGGCRDSDVTYPLYESRTGCSVTMDLANAKAFPTSKLAFKVGSVEMNATECRAVAGTTGIALQEEACDPMWENDFVNNVSYLVTRIYYIDDQTGNKVYASQCGRSATVSFPHVIDTTGCGWIMDDEHLLAYQQGKTIIKTGSLAGDVVVRDCHTTATVNYSYLGSQTNATRFDTSGSFTIPAGVSSAAVLLVSSGGSTRLGSPNNGGLAGASSIVELGNSVAGKTATFTIEQPVGSEAEQGAAWPSVPARTTTVVLDGTTYNVSTPLGFDTGTQNCAEHTGYFSAGRFGINGSADYPIYYGTKGFGAGAPSGCTSFPWITAKGMFENCWMVNGTTIYVKGLPGVVIFEYTTPKYMRPDGTEFSPAN